MSEQILEHLFDSPVKVKLLKLFLRNPDKKFLLSDIVGKSQADAAIVKKQIAGLEMISFLKKKILRADKKTNSKGGEYYSVNPQFEFYNELCTLVLKSSPTSKEKILQKIVKLGNIKLAMIAGVFLNNANTRLDLFLVGDDISSRRLSSFLAEMEAEVGREIQYAVMETKEFGYRYHMFDRFVRDILEKPHEKLVNKIKFIEQARLEG